MNALLVKKIALHLLLSKNAALLTQTSALNLEMPGFVGNLNHASKAKAVFHHALRMRGEIVSRIQFTGLTAAAKGVHYIMIAEEIIGESVTEMTAIGVNAVLAEAFFLLVVEILVIDAQFHAPLAKEDALALDLRYAMTMVTMGALNGNLRTAPLGVIAPQMPAEGELKMMIKLNNI